ncbi:MAG TPA: adenosylmethionine decarboxylase [Burkholderiaceae bacterium]
MSEAPLGRHALADLQGVAPAMLGDALLIESLLTRAAVAAGATPIFAKFHHFGAGQGVTGVLLLAESHISIHTWPEHGFAAVDAFMCGAAQPDLAVRIVCDALHPEHCETRMVERGLAVIPV